MSCARCMKHCMYVCMCMCAFVCVRVCVCVPALTMHLSLASKRPWTSSCKPPPPPSVASASASTRATSSPPQWCATISHTHIHTRTHARTYTTNDAHIESNNALLEHTAFPDSCRVTDALVQKKKLDEPSRTAINRLFQIVNQKVWGTRHSTRHTATHAHHITITCTQM